MRCCRLVRERGLPTQGVADVPEPPAIAAEWRCVVEVAGAPEVILEASRSRFAVRLSDWMVTFMFTAG